MKYLSGIRPTGRLHLGNYIGAILPAIKYNADVLIAEYHAPYSSPDELYTQLVKYIKPDKIKLQSEVFDAVLYFKLLEVTPCGLLSHMPQYKSKDKNAHMFMYPVLMAQDLVGYDYVIVGEDQRPHIELAEHILSKLGIPCPKAVYEGGKIMSFRQPHLKMSKSDPNSCLFLDDSPDDVYKKIMKAVTTDSGRANLEFISTALGGEVPDLNKELKEEIIRLCGSL